MWNCSSKGLRAYKESAAELPALTVTVLALHSRTCSNENKYSLFTDYISWTVAWVLAMRFHGLRDLTFKNPGKIFNLTLCKLLSCALGVTMIRGGAASILNEYIEKLSWFPDTEICWISALACSFAGKLNLTFSLLLPLSCTSPVSDCS